MSRTINTSPSAVVAIDAGAMDHTCDPEGRCPAYDIAWYRGDHSCRPNYDHPAVVHCGGANRGQSGWATLRERQHRADARAKLTAAVRAANARTCDDDLWDIDVHATPRSIAWDLW